MAWAALDDGFHEDPRTVEAGLAAAGLYACASTYIARHLTDGVIPVKVLERLLEHGDTAPLDALVRVGMVEQCEGGYRLVDYLHANPTREKAEAKRAAAAARKAAARARWEARQAAVASAAPTDAGDREFEVL
jgi:hypothetical protein